MNDIATSTTAASMSRRARNAVMAAGSLGRAPLLDPQRRRAEMAGGGHSLQPLREDEGLRAEVERQGGQLLGIDLLEAPPQGGAPVPVQLHLDAVDEAVHLRVAEA